MYVQNLEDDGSLIVSGPVFIPGSLDCEAGFGEKPLKSDLIRRLRDDFQDYQLIDLEHQFFTTGETIGEVLDSRILSEPTLLRLNFNSTETLYPRGTWVVTLRITNPLVVDGIRNGEYTGLSPTTINRSDANNLKMMMSTKSVIHRVLVSDIPDPVTVTISVTQQPCNPAAKFCSLQDNDDYKSKRTCGCENMTSVDEQLDGAAKSFIESIKEIFRSEKSVRNHKKEEKDDDEIKTVKEEKVEVTPLDTTSKKEEENDDTKKGVDTKESIKEEENDDKNVEYVTREDFEAFKKEIRNINKEALTNSQKEEEIGIEGTGEDTKIKASSKSIPVHETEQDKTKLSDTATVYQIMGRNNTGSAKKH